MSRPRTQRLIDSSRAISSHGWNGQSAFKRKSSSESMGEFEERPQASTNNAPKSSRGNRESDFSRSSANPSGDSDTITRGPTR